MYQILITNPVSFNNPIDSVSNNVKYQIVKVSPDYYSIRKNNKEILYSNNLKNSIATVKALGGTPSNTYIKNPDGGFTMYTYRRPASNPEMDMDMDMEMDMNPESNPRKKKAKKKTAKKSAKKKSAKKKTAKKKSSKKRSVKRNPSEMNPRKKKAKKKTAKKSAKKNPSKNPGMHDNPKKKTQDSKSVTSILNAYTKKLNLKGLR